jgi:hypothetical protein
MVTYLQVFWPNFKIKFSSALVLIHILIKDTLLQTKCCDPPGQSVNSYYCRIKPFQSLGIQQETIMKVYSVYIYIYIYMFFRVYSGVKSKFGRVERQVRVSNYDIISH